MLAGHEAPLSWSASCTNSGCSDSALRMDVYYPRLGHVFNGELSCEEIQECYYKNKRNIKMIMEKQWIMNFFMYQ